MSKFMIPKAYGGVTLMVSLVTGGCLVMGDLDRAHRQQFFTNDFLEFTFNELHQKEIGDDVAA